MNPESVKNNTVELGGDQKEDMIHTYRYKSYICTNGFIYDICILYKIHDVNSF